MSEPVSKPAGEGEPDETDLAAALDRFLEQEQALFGQTQQMGLPELSAGDRFEPGGTIGDYELIRRLGVGGMGVVFEARQRSVAGRRVAVKILRDLFASPALEERFRREVATVARFDHPGIVPIVDAKVERGTPYFVMKFIEGLTLAQLISRLRERSRFPQVMEDVRKIVTLAARTDSFRVVESGSGGGVGSEFEDSYERWVARLGRSLADALQYAHEHGFVHRDVKPGNVMITLRGGPVLLDFGLASSNLGDALTRTGEFLGTAAYAAPEQLRGEAADERADVYSLGATLYELLSLRRPHEAPNRSALLHRQEFEDPSTPGSWVPADLRTIVLKALAFSPAQRYAHPRELADDLGCFLEGRPIRARRPGIVRRLFRLTKRYPRLVVASFAVLIVLVVVRGADHLAARDRVSSGRDLLEQGLAEQARWNDLLERHALLKSQEPVPFPQLAPLAARIDSASLEVNRQFGQAEDELRRAFDSVAGHAPARAVLAELHAARLRQALRVYADLLQPEELRRIEDDLRRVDDQDLHQALLNRVGSARLRCSQGEARLEIQTDGSSPRTVFSGTTGEDPIALPEGSYIARATLAGFADVRLHLLVRGDACYDEPSARPARDHDLVFLRAGEIPDGFVQIPAGDSLIEDDPPRWEFVESFLIQEHEVTNGAFIAWLDALGDEAPADFPSPEIEGTPYIHRGDDGKYDLDLGQQQETPLRGLSPMAMNGYARLLGRIRPLGREDRFFSLPTVAELMRAGRGADGRRYPWGRGFRYDACANYLSTVGYGSDTSPVAVRSFAADRSPFGVFDLAGSVAEATRDPLAPLPGHYAVLGGSFRSTAADTLAVTHVRGLRNGPAADVGFRLVLRTLPVALREPDRAPEPFEDHFDRPDSKQVGNGWIQVIGSEPLAMRTNPTTEHGSEIREGRLVCQSGTGNFSETSSAWRRIHLSESGWRVTAAIEGRVEAGFSAWADQRSFGLVLASSVRNFESDRLNLQLSHGEGRRLGLTWTRPNGSTTAVESLLDECPDLVEIERVGNEVCVRAWSHAASRPRTPELTFPLPPGVQCPRYVGLTVSVGGGASAELDWIRVEPGP